MGVGRLYRMTLLHFQLLCWLCNRFFSIFCRIWTLNASHDGRKGLLHVIRTRWDSHQPRHVPECWRTPQLRHDLHPKNRQKMPQTTQHRSHPDPPHHHLCQHFNSVPHNRSARVQQIRELGVFRQSLLLLYNIDYNRVR